MAITGDFNIHICCAADTLGIENINIPVCDHFSIVFFFLTCFTLLSQKFHQPPFAPASLTHQQQLDYQKLFHASLPSSLMIPTSCSIILIISGWLHWTQRSQSISEPDQPLQSPPWCTDHTPFLKREVHKVERKWKTFKLHVLYDHLKILMKNYNA